MELPALTDSEFRQFRSFIFRVAGISMSDAKRPLVSGRLAKRVRQRGTPSYDAYFQLIQRDQAECQMAVDLLTTNETYFFREPKHFDFLREQCCRTGKGASRCGCGAAPAPRARSPIRWP